MKNLILPLLSLSFLFLSPDCLGEERLALKPEVKQKVIKALDLNDELHMAFFDYEEAKVRKEAKALKESLQAIKDEKLAKLFEPAIKELLKIETEKSREKNNEHYAKASLSLVYLVNKYDVGPGYNEYTCPMVKKKWVQNSKKRNRTHNPYAPEMPHCGGRVTDY